MGQRRTGRVLWLRPKLMNTARPVDKKIPVPISRKPAVNQEPPIDMKINSKIDKTV